MLGEIAQLSCTDDEFEAVFVTRAGVERRVPWRWLPEAVDELERPVRSFPSYRGQRNYPGWYWACTLGRLIGFESWAESMNGWSRRRER